MTWPSWPWKRRGSLADLEARVQQLEQANIRILGILEGIAQTMDISREAEEMQTAIRDLRGQLPDREGDLPPYIW